MKRLLFYCLIFMSNIDLSAKLPTSHVYGFVMKGVPKSMYFKMLIPLLCKSGLTQVTLVAHDLVKGDLAKIIQQRAKNDKVMFDIITHSGFWNLKNDAENINCYQSVVYGLLQAYAIFKNRYGACVVLTSEMDGDAINILKTNDPEIVKEYIADFEELRRNSRQQN